MTAAAPYHVRPMQLADIRQVMHIERRSFSMPWPAFVYVHEINSNPVAFMGVIEAAHIPPVIPHARLSRLSLLRTFEDKTPFAAYGGVWMDGDEGHISTIASAPNFRRMGFGELMLTALLGRAITQGMTRAALEVRLSNTNAQALYLKYGFVIDGHKQEYYHDNNEDAYIMRVPSLGADYQAFLREKIAALRERIAFVDTYSGFA